MSTLCYHSGYNHLYAIADALHWLLAMSGVKHLFHYFDGYIIVAQPQSTALQVPAEYPHV